MLLVFLLGSQIENHLLSTGAFEVYVNGALMQYLIHAFAYVCVHTGELVWSKMESGRLPSLDEVKNLLVTDYNVKFEDQLSQSIPASASS